MAGFVETPEIVANAPIRHDPNTALMPYYPLGNQSGYSLAVCAFPSPATRQKIHTVAEQIRQEFPDHFYAPKSYLHLTITALGTVATAQEVVEKQRELDDTLQNISRNLHRIALVVQGVSHFSNCFFAQVFDESEALDMLHQSLINISETPETLPFVPHITMGYNKGPAHDLGQYINTKFPWVDFGTDSISAIHLTAFDSQLSIYDEPYEVIGSYPLHN